MRHFAKSKSGMSGIEYAMIAALIAITLIVSMRAMGASVRGMLAGVAPAIGAATP